MYTVLRAKWSTGGSLHQRLRNTHKGCHLICCLFSPTHQTRILVSGKMGAMGRRAITSGFEISSMILTACQTQTLQPQPVPNVALSPLLIRGYRMFLGQVGFSSRIGHFGAEKIF